MANTTKRALVQRISREVGLRQDDVYQIVQRTLDHISEAVSKGLRVELRDFGVFKVKVQKPRIGRNPKRRATDFRIPARAVVKFKAGKLFKAAVLKLSPNGTGSRPVDGTR